MYLSHTGIEFSYEMVMLLFGNRYNETRDIIYCTMRKIN